MSWYDDEADENAQQETREAARRKIVAQSNYWARLVQQVREDVEGVNKSPYWKPKLQGFPLRFDPIFGGDGYQVIKSGSLPNVIVAFQTYWDRVLVVRKFSETKTTLSKEFLAKENLYIVVLANSVILINREREQQYLVPAEASGHILKAITAALKPISI